MPLFALNGLLPSMKPLRVMRGPAIVPASMRLIRLSSTALSLPMSRSEVKRFMDQNPG